MSIKKRLRNYFGFSKTETNAFLLLFPLSFSLLLVHSITRKQLFLKSEFDKNDLQLLSEFNEKIKSENALKNITASDTFPALELKPFDPNKIKYENLIKYSLPNYVVRNWTNYTKNGGKIKDSADVMKIYGMKSNHYKIIKPFLIFNENRTNNVKRTDSFNELSDINKADTTELKNINGVGSKLSNRIIRFRDKLGGFISIEQLYEVYYLDSSVVEKISQKFKIQPDFIPKRIKINSSETDELKSHPYISYKLAKLIYSFRKQRPFSKAEDLWNIPIVDSTTYLKIKPYLDFQLD